MASPEHLVSSSFIKSVHEKLRKDAKILGAEEAWQEHCKDEDNLQKYASAMQNLAVNHWENNYNKNVKTSSRVEWVFQYTQKYFIQEEMLTHRQREQRIAQKINLEVPTTDLNVDKKYKLLDVGSCYNPFKKYDCFDVLAIDIAPATDDVYKCDFLNLELTSSDCSVNSSEISELQCESFDIIVFSLLLEYLPSPTQRQLCCVNAYKLLKTEGILFIITPDSKHVGANAKIMKSWRLILAKLGYSRIKYEKLEYLHCMVFRKSLKPEIPQRWAFLQKEAEFYDKIVIPQDFKKVIDSSEKPNCDISCDVGLFEELPFL